MIRFCVTAVFLFIMMISIFAQKVVKVEGRILDSETHQVVSDASVIVSTSNGVNSNAAGCFSLQVKQGDVHLSISHTQYKPQDFYLKLNSDTTLTFLLDKSINEIDEVEVLASKNNFVKNVIPGMVALEQKDFTSQPALLGVPDVITTLQRGTGIQSVNEGIAGIYVRGGGAGQNLILYDNIELVDPSHLLGTYSAFNPYLVERVELYKGNSPVQYADRLSSSIIVSSFDDVSDQAIVTANIGTLASTAAVTYQKDKFGIMVGARRTQLEIYKEAVIAIVPNSEGFVRTNSYNFFDFNGKVFYNNKKHDQLALSWYWGGDDMVYNGNSDVKVGTKWQNKGTALTWKHTMSNYSLKTVLGFTNYEFSFSGDIMNYQADFDSQYSTAYLKHVFNKEIDQHLLTLNGNVHYYDVVPQRASVSNSENSYSNRDEYRSAEFSLAIADNWQINDQLTLYYGLRANEFVQLGPATYYEIEGADTIALDYSKGESIQHYFNISPQAFLTWEQNDNLAYKLAYSYNNQNIHRGSLATLPLPSDLWISSTKLIKPEHAHLLSIGAYKTRNGYDFSAEVYGKIMDNILLFETNLTGELTPNFEDNFKAGEGYSVGLELLARKNFGKLNGWVAYTLSKSRKRIYGINNDEWFDAKYDRIHDLSIVANYRLNKRWDFSSAFVLASGNKTTIPAGRYLMMGYIMNDYTAVNDFRMPIYHRLDLSVNYHLKPRFFKESILNMSIINVYNRHNTYFFFYEVRGNLEESNISVKPNQFSLFPVLPSLSWTFKF